MSQSALLVFFLNILFGCQKQEEKPHIKAEHMHLARVSGAPQASGARLKAPVLGWPAALAAKPESGTASAPDPAVFLVDARQEMGLYAGTAVIHHCNRSVFPKKAALSPGQNPGLNLFRRAGISPTQNRSGLGKNSSNSWGPHSEELAPVAGGAAWHRGQAQMHHIPKTPASHFKACRPSASLPQAWHKHP